MRTQLVTIPTGTIPLDGAFHEPDSGSAAGAALLFHGNTMNFYVGAPRFLPPVLTRLGLACLAFNRRGHDVLSTRISRVAEGGPCQVEIVPDCDHFYNGNEERVAGIVAAWLASTPGLPKA